jgi:hypothetical protein
MMYLSIFEDIADLAIMGGNLEVVVIVLTYP